MMNEESAAVDVRQVENNVPEEKAPEKKQKKKVHFSDKNEMIYYEKEETEDTYNFGMSFGNFNYIECLYNRLYDYNYDDKEAIHDEHTFMNDERVNNYLPFYDENLEEEEEEEGISEEEEHKDSEQKEDSSMSEDSITAKGKMKKDSIALNELKKKKKAPNRFAQSFNEDCSFEVNDINKALLDAEEKTIHYSKDYFGYDIEPFNMKDELKEGYIDKDGNYVYNEDGEHDEIEEAWLQSVDQKDAFTTFKNETLRTKLFKDVETKMNENTSRNNKKNEMSINIYDGIYSLSALLIEKETPIKAMVRYKKNLEICKTYLKQYKENLNSKKASPVPTSEQETSQNDEEEPAQMNIKKKEIGLGEDVEKIQNNVHNTINVEDVNKITLEETEINQENKEETNEKTQTDTPQNNNEISSEQKENDNNTKIESKNEQIDNKENENTTQCNNEIDTKENALLKDDETNVEREETDEEENDGAGDQKEIQYEQSKEYQKYMILYQKMELNYKNLERQFNCLIELAQKLTNEYRNVYFLNKEDLENLIKKMEDHKENCTILWQFQWCNDSDHNIFGPFKYEEIYQWISVGYVSPINPIKLRRVNEQNEVLEDIWQPYDSINYLTFVSNDNFNKKRKLEDIDIEEEDEEIDDEESEDQEIYNNKKKKRKGLIQISKKKIKKNESEQKEEEEEDDDDDETDLINGFCE